MRLLHDGAASSRACGEALRLAGAQGRRAGPAEARVGEAVRRDVGGEAVVRWVGLGLELGLGLGLGLGFGFGFGFGFGLGSRLGSRLGLGLGVLALALALTKGDEGGELHAVRAVARGEVQLHG